MSVTSSASHLPSSDMSTTSQPKLSPSFHIEGILGMDSKDPTSTTPPSPSSPADHQLCPPRNRRRRTRTIYTPEQLVSMEAVFATNQYPDINTRDTLADSINLTEARVQVWFQNRRARQKRQGKRHGTDSDSVSSGSTGSETNPRPSSVASSTASTDLLQDSSPSPSPKPCTPSTSAADKHDKELSVDIKTPSVPSPPSEIVCSLPCCSPPSIYSPYPALYPCTPKSQYATAPIPSYGLPAGYPYSAVPTPYAFPGSRAAYYQYYRSSALTNVTACYQRPTVFNFPPVAGSNLISRAAPQASFPADSLKITV